MANNSSAADTNDMTAGKRTAGRVESALSNARDTANGALKETKDAARRAGAAIEANPMAVVVGGIAMGLAAGTLLPKTKRETELLGPVGRRLTDVASGAASAAKDAAKVELAAIPLSKDAARDQVSKVIDQFAKAISGAGEAALASKRETVVDNKPAPRKSRQKAD